MFTHKTLQVHSKAVDFAAQSAAWTSTWENKRALMDHLSMATDKRAMEWGQTCRFDIRHWRRTIAE